MTSLAEMQARLQAARKDGDTIAFVSGNFNILHPGHVRFLQFAKSNATFLVVGVAADGPPAISVDADMRLAAVQSIGAVDFAFVLKDDVVTAIKALKPNVVAKGKEHQCRANPEQAAVESYGGRLLFNSGEMRFTDLGAIERQYEPNILSPFRLDHGFLERHKYTAADVLGLLEEFRKLRVLVIGDLIIDEYIDCEPLGMSQEDATIVVSPIGRRQFVGGSGIVSAHCASLGAGVEYVTVGSDGPLHGFALESLRNNGVNPHFFADPSRPLTLKQRYRVHNKTMLRVSELRQHAIERRIQNAIFERVGELISSIDLIIFSDFNYGCIPTELATRITRLAKEHGVRLAADSQASSQMADISRFWGMDIITPTEREARLALKDAECGLVELGERLRIAAEANNVIITLGADGLLIHAPRYGLLRTDRIKAMNVRPQDVAGAGDSLLSAVALGLCAGADIWLSAYLGSVAAACQVSVVGNSPLSPQTIAEALG
jgi:rfaE bifunctional protein kinase chain/domain